MIDSTQLDQKTISHFLYWMRERHAIYRRRMAGTPLTIITAGKEECVWTRDKVLQKYFFTNPFREHDKTTKWFKKWVRDPLRLRSSVLMATFIFRRFNLIETGQILLKEGLLESWDSRQAKLLLGDKQKQGQKIFTGAYMISSPAGKTKLDEICRMIDDVWDRRDTLIEAMENATTLEEGFKLMQCEHHKGLLPYEVVTDLRWTYLLCEASDIDTWAYFGPGGQRGVARILGKKPDELRRRKKADRVSGPFEEPSGTFAVGGGKQADRLVDQQTCLEVGRLLLPIVRDSLPALHDEYLMEQCMDPERTFRSPASGGIQSVIKPCGIELRDVEHSLCEADKYLRMCEGSGRSKRLYRMK